MKRWLSVLFLFLSPPLLKGEMTPMLQILEERGIDHIAWIDGLSMEEKYELARDVLIICKHPRAHVEYASYSDFLKGGALVAAGVILTQYPQPFRIIGISLITSGITLAGREYISDFTDYLVDKGYVKEKDLKKVQDVYNQYFK